MKFLDQRMKAWRSNNSKKCIQFYVSAKYQMTEFFSKTSELVYKMCGFIFRNLTFNWPNLPRVFLQIVLRLSSKTENWLLSDQELWRTVFLFSIYHTVLHYTILHWTVLQCIILHCTSLHCHYTTLHWTVLHCIILHCTSLHYTTLHWTVLQNTTNIKFNVNVCWASF